MTTPGLSEGQYVSDLEVLIIESRRERDEALAQNWKYILQIADMANQIEDLEILNRALGLELDYLRGHRDARTP